MTAPRIGITALKARGALRRLAAHLDEIEGLGVDFVELPLYDLDLVVGGRIHAPHLKLLREAIADRPFDFTAHGPHPTNFFDRDEMSQRHFEVLKAMLDIAAEARARRLVIHTGFRKSASSEPIEDAYARQRAWLAKAGDAARPLGITIGVENVYDWEWGGLYTATPSRLAAEIAEVGHPNVRATLDVGHAQLEVGMRGGNLLEEVRALSPFACHVHVHDNFGRPDDTYMHLDGERLAYGQGDLHLPVGWGSTPWDAIVAECSFPADVGLNIELETRHWHAAAESIAATRALAAKLRVLPE